MGCVVRFKKIVERSNRLKMALCCYHSETDQLLLESQLEKMNLFHDTTSGYMWYPYCAKQRFVSTKFTRAVIRAWNVN